MNITTAVDSLVNLVNSKKRISLEDVSKELGIPEHILNEWATFLEEEGVLVIEYKFTTPFLLAKIKKEENLKEYSQEADVIKRNLEVMLITLKKLNIPHKQEIKKVEDIKLANGINSDVVYAQKFVLEVIINKLIKSIEKTKEFDKTIYEDINLKYQDIENKKQIFDKNFKNLKL